MSSTGTMAPPNRTCGKHSIGSARAACAALETAADASSPSAKRRRRLDHDRHEQQGVDVPAHSGKPAEHPQHTEEHRAHSRQHRKQRRDLGCHVGPDAEPGQPFPPEHRHLADDLEKAVRQAEEEAVERDPEHDLGGPDIGCAAGSNAPRLNSVAIIAVTSTGEPSRIARVSRLRNRTSTLRRVRSHHCRTAPVCLTANDGPGWAAEHRHVELPSCRRSAANRSAQICGVSCVSEPLVYLGEILALRSSCRASAGLPLKARWPSRARNTTRSHLSIPAGS